MAQSAAPASETNGAQRRVRLGTARATSVASAETQATAAGAAFLLGIAWWYRQPAPDAGDLVAQPLG